MASIKWSASDFEKYWMPKLSTQSVKVVLREICPESGGLGHGLVAETFKITNELVKRDDAGVY